MWIYVITLCVGIVIGLWMSLMCYTWHGFNYKEGWVRAQALYEGKCRALNEAERVIRQLDPGYYDRPLEMVQEFEGELVHRTPPRVEPEIIDAEYEQKRPVQKIGKKSKNIQSQPTYLRHRKE